MTTVQDALRHGSRKLAEAGSDEAGLEAELLLAHALNTDRTHLSQRLRERLASDAANAFEALLQRRLAHEPTAYILGHKEFYGLDLEVTPAAIIPRPETETLVELVAAFARRHFRHAPQTTIVDVGTGCGAVAIALALELPGYDIVAIDQSHDALDLARRNARKFKLGRSLRFVHGDLLTPVKRPVDVIAANLPYVRTADLEAAPLEIREHEPRLGLDGGPDGLRLIQRLLGQAPSRLRPGGALFVEIGEEQGDAARKLALAPFPQARVEVKQDLSGLDRVLVVPT